MEALLNWEPVEHIVGDMAKLRHTTNYTSSRPQQTIQRLQSNLRESTVGRRVIVRKFWM